MKYALFILVSLFSVQASAGIYKCKDAKGNTEYRSGPCKEGHSNVQINVKTGTSVNLDDKEKEQAIAQKEQQTALEKQKLEHEAVQKKQANANMEAILESAKNQALIKNNPDKFSAYAIPPYVPDKLPDLVKTYQDRLPEIERLRRETAEKALASGQCIRVESVELNSQSTQDALMFLINCSSGKSFYFKEQDLKK